ncbi:hypothetical protein SDC9_110779 [bioreactor metagenome]|uniref:Uncharacterized protein n=1 Tax=bioreactor metagenome TaxID=1076179 RepID=A0A645BEL7_9ZZZZ
MDFPSLRVRCLDLRTPLIMTRSPGVTFPVRSSSASTSRLWGCEPPLRFSGDSWIWSFWASIKVESSIETLNGPFFPHVSSSQPAKGSSNLKLFCSTMVRCPHLRHWKAAFVILGLTSVAFLIMPSIATKRERCLLLSSLIGTLFGIFITLT